MLMLSPQKVPMSSWEDNSRQQACLECFLVIYTDFSKAFDEAEPNVMTFKPYNYYMYLNAFGIKEGRLMTPL